VKWKGDWVRNGKHRLKRYWLQYAANQEKENRNNLGSVDRDQGQSQGLEQPSQSALLQDKEANHFWAWIDLRTGGAVKDDYERYCLNSEPETSVENPL